MHHMEMQYAYKESSSSSSSIERRGGGGISAVGIVSLVLAVLALMVGAMNYVFLTKILAETKKNASDTKNDEEVSLASIK